MKTCYKTIVFHSSGLKHLSVIGDFLASARPESIMLQNLPIMHFGTSLIIYLLYVLVFILSGLHYADN